MFSGLGRLPKNLDGLLAYKRVREKDTNELRNEFYLELRREVKRRFEDEILARPYAQNWGFGNYDEEYVIKIFITKPTQQLDSQELEKLQKPIDDFRIELQYIVGPC